MAWFGPLLIGSGITYGVTSGKFAEWSGFKAKNQQRDGSHQHQSQSQQQQLESLSPQPPQPPQVIVYESPNARASRSWMYSLSGTALLALAGYYYYIHKWGTKKVISRVEETAEETQNLVDKADKNNSKRFSELDARNTERAHTLEAEIRSETRAGFGMLSEQIYGLTQICIETLAAIAHGGNASIELNDDIDNDNQAGNNQNEFGRVNVNENLLQYSESAQQKADTIISPETLMTKKAAHLQDIRAEIYQRNPLETNSQQQEYVTPGGDTPGGPGDNNYNNNNNIPRGINNVFDMDANQKPWLTSISYKDNEHNLNELDDNNRNRDKGKKKGSKKNNRDGIMGYILNNEYISKYIPFNDEMSKYFKIVKIGNEIKENQDKILFGLAAMVASYNAYYFFTSKNSNRMSPMVGYDSNGYPNPNANANANVTYNTNDNRVRQ